MASITEFIDIKNSNIEEWTKKELRSIFWANLTLFFSKAVSEKNNIDQYFLIARAALWEHKKKNPTRAIENYNNAININPNSLWGRQAKSQIIILQEREAAESQK